MGRYWILMLSLLLFSCGERGERGERSAHKKKRLKIVDHLELERTFLQVEELVTGMDVPWDMEFGQDGFLWVTEQAGKIYRINPETGEKLLVLHLKDVFRKRTTGLLGIAVHPDFARYPFVFLNYTVKRDSSIFSRLMKYTYAKQVLTKPELLLEINGNTGHNGSRLKISPDGKLIWATGDAHDNKNAQDLKCLNGKVLRLNIDGSIPADNPYPGSYVWARGFRNIQGLTYSTGGKLYTSEHGDAIEDEVNLINSGRNYGWSNIEGMHDLPEEKRFAQQWKTTEPLRSWTPVIAPSGMDYYGSNEISEWHNSLLMTTLKGQSLRMLKLDDNGREITEEWIYFDKHYGRLRDVCVGSDGVVFISTSNRDWNPGPGFPLKGDDRILKIKVSRALKPDALRGHVPVKPVLIDGKALYAQYCASCHKDDGKGVEGIFPALVNSTIATGRATTLIHTVLKGKSGSAQQMPAFGFLPDEELSAVLNYIRNSWGNKAAEIQKEQINQKR